MRSQVESAFAVAIANVQVAKDDLGIDRVIELFLVEDTDGPYAWFDCEVEPWRIVMVNTLTPALASWCIWHELGHARQVTHDYAGDGAAFLSDYRAHAYGDLYEDQRNGVDADLATRRWSLQPWEAEAHLTAWEGRLRAPLTDRGEPLLIDPTQPADAARYLSNCKITPEEITSEGLAYRHGMRA